MFVISYSDNPPIIFFLSITILSTFKLIEDRDSETIQNNKLKNAKKCIQWCIKNNIVHHKNVPSINGFLINKRY